MITIGNINISALVVNNVSVTILVVKYIKYTSS